MKSNETITLYELLPLVRELTAKGEELEIKPKGKSMLPTIKEGRDTVLLSSAYPPFRRGDILLFCRKNGTPVLHRVVKVQRDGTLVMRGDAQYFTETITNEQVVAAVKRYFRGKRMICADARGVRLRTSLLLALYPVRHFCVRVKNKLTRGMRHREG